MVGIFQILAAILAGAAVFFWWRDNPDWAFASGVFAAASYFLGLRFQMKARVAAVDAEKEREEAELQESDSDELGQSDDPDA